MEEKKNRDIFSVLEDGQSYKVEPKTLRRDRKPLKIKKQQGERVVRKKKEESENIEPDVDFTKD